MNKRVLAFDLSEEDLNRVISEVRNYRQSLKQKQDKLLLAIANEISQEAQQGFDNAIVDDLTAKTGEPRKANVNVSVEQQDDFVKVVSDGTDAIWVEFGAGVYHNGPAGTSPNPFADTVTGIPNPPIAIGTFGTRGERKAWVFFENGQMRITHGTPAAMPMYNAVQTVSSRIPHMVKEVFG